MSTFTPEKIILNPGDLLNAEVDFYLYEIYPVIYVNHSPKGELGCIALFGEIRSFPLEEIYSYNAIQLSEQEFFDRFPKLRVYFEAPVKQAA